MTLAITSFPQSWKQNPLERCCWVILAVRSKGLINANVSLCAT